MTVYSSTQKPSLVTAIAVMTLISGVVNIFWGLIASLVVTATLVGIICTPFTILPTILGVFEVLYAAKLLANSIQPVRPSPAIAAFEIACILAGNAFSMIVGILSLVFYNDLMVKAWFEEVNGPQTASQSPAPILPELESAPVQDAPEVPAEPETPAEPEAPESPHRPRKVA